MTRIWLAGAAIIGLCGCGSGSGSGSGESGPIGGAKVTDACAAIDKGVVAATLRSAVKSTELSAVQADPDRADLYSQCTFVLADNRIVVIGTGKSTTGADVAALADRYRKESAGAGSTPSDVAGVGKAAVWADKLQSLYVFPGDGRYLTITTAQMAFGKAKVAPDTIKADAIALAGKLGA